MTSLVLVYGSLKEGFYNHSVLRGAKFIGTHVTSAVWSMYDMGAYPAIEPEGHTAIHCELYRVENLDALDILEGYPHFYNRKLVSTEYGDAWIYYIEDHSFNCKTLMPEGHWYE